MTVDELDKEGTESTDVAAAPEESVGTEKSYMSGLIKVALTAVWVVLIAYLVGLLSSELTIAAGKAKLLNKGMFPVNATLLGLMTVIWVFLPVVFGAVAHRWLGRDSLFIAPLLGAAVFAVGSLLGLQWPEPASGMPLVAIVGFAAIATLLGALIAGVVSSRKAAKSATA